MYNKFTRRQMLTTAVAAAAAVTAQRAIAKPSQPSTAVDFKIPEHACDCHTHIYGELTKFPLAPAHLYTPDTALPDEMSALHRALHMERVVIVTPSVYGADNSSTLYGMKTRGATARGVAVINEKTPEHALEEMNAAGVRGIRINLSTLNHNDPDLGRRLFAAAVMRVQKYKWNIQMYTNLPVIAKIKDLVQGSPVPVVFDHFGGADAALGLAQPGWSDLLEVVHSGHAYVKISGAYRSSTHAPEYADVTPFARALINANAERIVWGSDWPHPNSSPAPGSKITDITPFYRIDDGLLLNQLAHWEPDAKVREKILVDNPVRLYGF